MPIRGKGYAIDDISMPAHPEQASVLHVPQLDRPIVARARQSASIRTEGKEGYDIGMCRETQMKGLPPLVPYPNFSLHAACGPQLSFGTCGHRPDDIESRSP